MKASELRIGNYFEYKGRIIKFTIADFVEAHHNSELLELFLKPILLTEEWMIKVGFERYGHAKDVKISISKGWTLYFDFDLNKLSIDSGLNGKFLDEIKYVHQLQNLYFALTGEELTIK